MFGLVKTMDNKGYERITILSSKELRDEIINGAKKMNLSMTALIKFSVHKFLEEQKELNSDLKRILKPECFKEKVGGDKNE